MEMEKKSNGAVVGLVIIIIILALGGIYIWRSRDQSGAAEPQVPVDNQDTAALDALERDAKTTDTSTGVNPNTVY